jgi:hypothetical protein
LPESLEPGIYAHTDKPLRYIEQTIDDVHQTQSDYSDSNHDNQNYQNISISTTSGQLSGSSQFATTQQQSSLSLPQIPSARGGKPLLPALKLPPTPTITNPEVIDNQVGTFDDQFRETQSEYDDNHEGGDQDLPPSLQDLLTVIEQHRKKLKPIKGQAKDRVMAQAFQRCLAELETDATLSDRRRFEEMKTTETWKDTIVTDKEKMKNQVSELKKQLCDQIEESRQRMEMAKLDKRSAIIALLPDNAPMRSTFDKNGNLINSRQHIAKDLEIQKHNNAELREQEKKELQKKEYDYIQRVTLENELDRVIQRSRYLEEQKALVEAWERDGHIRNIRRLQPLGSSLVQDYIVKHLKDPVLSMSTIPNSMEKSLRISIGYDPRKGKL